MTASARSVEAVLALIGKNDDARLMGLEDGHILDDVPHDGFRDSRRAQTMISGSADRSMCFLFSTTSEEMVL